ncbi:MAG: hypothetical protein WBY94_27480 [Polyangiaceae bacterium]
MTLPLLPVGLAAGLGRSRARDRGEQPGERGRYAPERDYPNSHQPVADPRGPIFPSTPGSFLASVEGRGQQNAHAGTLLRAPGGYFAQFSIGGGKRKGALLTTRDSDSR